IRQLLEDPGISRTLDEEYLAHFIARGECPTELTPYKSIKRLPAASFIIVEERGLRIQKYWDLDPENEIHCSSDQEYGEQLRSLFFDSVRASLRSCGPVWSELSGGLDSSSIVCTAQEIYRAGEVPNNGFTTITAAFDESTKVDEKRWSRLVIDKYGINAVFFPADHYWVLKDFDQEVPYWDEPTPKGLITAQLRAQGSQVLETGGRVILSGMGGDQVFMGGGQNPVHLADLLRGFRLRQLARELGAWQRHLNLPFSRVFLDNCVKPLLKPNTMSDHSDARLWKPARWILQSYSKRTGLEDLMAQRFLSRRYKSPAAQRQYLVIMRTSAAMVKAPLMHPTIDHRCPFLYRPLIEFAMGIPMEQKLRPGGDTRSILRRAMLGVLPEEIRLRKTKAVFDQHIHSGIDREWARIAGLVDSPQLGLMGIVDPREFRRALEMIRIGHSEGIYQLISALALEFWLRASPEGQRTGSALVA
ncbi:MAG TPA: asparagine synthase-related protein, partial [Blastocatellia bacterium]|nr:asparagine synthase-related protein [Blastocatellia bacterium]